MAEQKAFYELPKPKKVIYTIAVQPDNASTCECAVPDCKTKADENEYTWNEDIDVYACDVCGQWFCIDHIDKNDLCPGCAKLPKGLQQEIITFREALNR